MYNKQLITGFGVDNTHFQDVHNKQKRRREITEEGVVVNTFIKENESETTDIPVKQTPLPNDMFVKKEKIAGKFLSNPVLPMIIAPLVVMGIGVGLSAFYKKSMTAKYGLKDPKLQIPPGGRIITINNDVSISLLALVQDPSKETFHAAAAVIAASATAFVLKNTVDGFKEVIVKKQAADIKRDKDEKLIDIETRSFSGKNQIVRNLMSNKDAELDTLAFGKNINKDSKEKDNPIKILGYVLLGAATIVASILCAKAILKNISHVDKAIKEKAKEAATGFEADIEKLKTRQNLEDELKNAKISEQAKDFVRSKWDEIHDPARMESPPRETNGNKGKTGLSAFVPADATSFIYTYLIQPTKQKATLASLMCAAAGLGYVGQAAVKGVKEVQVEKANAKTEVDLHDRLVQVELKNFYAKKNSYIQPIMEDAKEKLKSVHTPEERKKIKSGVLAEIKNGPPFVYS